jgi:hypothetical protein
LKIAILYFLALTPTLLQNFKRCRRRRKKMVSAAGDSASNFVPLLPTAIKKKNLNRTKTTFKQVKN